MAASAWPAVSVVEIGGESLENKQIKQGEIQYGWTPVNKTRIFFRHNPFSHDNFHKSGFRRVLLAFTGFKLWTTLIMVTISLAVPARAFTKYPIVESVFSSLEQNLASYLFLAPWYRFDTIHYLEIAAGGYSYPLLTVWAPFYPFLIHLLSCMGIPPMAAALIISNVACFLALYLVYRLAQDMVGMKMAQRVLVGMVIFPISYFLIAGYTESLFILISAAFLWCLMKNEGLLAALLGILAPLTRFQGAALAIPAAWMLYLTVRDTSPAEWSKSILKINSPLGAVILPPVSLSVWLGWVHFGLKNPWPWVLLSNFWDQHTGFPWEGIIGNLTSLLGLRYIQFTTINSIAQFYDLILVMVVIVSLVISIRINKSIPIVVHIFAWVNLLPVLVKVDNQYLLVSASRYLLSVFPIFIMIPLLLSQKRPG